MSNLISPGTLSLWCDCVEFSTYELEVWAMQKAVQHSALLHSPGTAWKGDPWSLQLIGNWTERWIELHSQWVETTGFDPWVSWAGCPHQSRSKGQPNPKACHLCKRCSKSRLKALGRVGAGKSAHGATAPLLGVTPGIWGGPLLELMVKPLHCELFWPFLLATVFSVLILQKSSTSTCCC